MRIPAYGSVMLTIFFIESFTCSDAMIKLDSLKKKEKKKKNIAKRRAVSTIQTNFKLKKNIYIYVEHNVHMMITAFSEKKAF